MRLHESLIPLLKQDLCPGYIAYMCPFFQRVSLNHGDLMPFFDRMFCTALNQGHIWDNIRASLVANWTWWMPEQTDQALNFFFFYRVCFISRTLTWGGVLLIPRSADEWRQGQTHMHVRLASIHSLSSSGGGQHQTNEGAIWLPPRQRHALPSS